MDQVSGPAVAAGEAHPLAGHPQVPLCGAGGVGGAECGGIQFRARGQVARDRRARRLPAGCRGARPAAARQGRRRGGRSRRPGSRARRCGGCRCAAAARAGCRRRSRDGRSMSGPAATGASIVSSAAAKSWRAASGAGAPNMAGHHQSNKVASAVVAIAAASQAGRSGGGAARWMATSGRRRRRMERATGRRAVSMSDEEQVVAEIFLEQQPRGFVGGEDLRHRHADAAPDAARCGRTAGRPPAAARPSARQDAGRRSAADSGGSWRPAPAVRSSRVAVAMARQECRDQRLAAHAMRPSRSGQPDSDARRLSAPVGCSATVSASIGRSGPAGPAIPPARCRRAPRPSPVPPDPPGPSRRHRSK